YLYIPAKNPCESYPQGRDLSCKPEFLFKLSHLFAAGKTQPLKVVEPGIETFDKNSTFFGLNGWSLHQSLREQISEVRHQVEFFRADEMVTRCFVRQGPNRVEHFFGAHQTATHVSQVSRCSFTKSTPHREAFEISHMAKRPLYNLAHFGVLNESFHLILPTADEVHISEGSHHAAAKESRTAWRPSSVHHVEQGSRFVPRGRLRQLQVTLRDAVRLKYPGRIPERHSPHWEGLVAKAFASKQKRTCRSPRCKRVYSTYVDPG